MKAIYWNAMIICKKKKKKIVLIMPAIANRFTYYVITKQFSLTKSVINTRVSQMKTVKIFLNLIY
jgi:hypothetical protein